jgi:hypothetical protein
MRRTHGPLTALLSDAGTVFHGSKSHRRRVGSIQLSAAVNSTVPATLVKRPGAPSGIEALDPGLMSSTRTVPSAVPSLSQGSRPWAGSKARNITVSSTAVRLALMTSPRVPGLLGIEWPGPGLMSRTRTVRWAVPSLFHSSRPCSGSEAQRTACPRHWSVPWARSRRPAIECWRAGVWHAGRMRAGRGGADLPELSAQRCRRACRASGRRAPPAPGCKERVLTWAPFTCGGHRTAATRNPSQ